MKKEQKLNEFITSNEISNISPLEASPPASLTGGELRKEVIFIESNLSDFSGNFKQLGKPDALHFNSFGTTGTLKLGSSTVSIDNLDGYGNEPLPFSPPTATSQDLTTESANLLGLQQPTDTTAIPARKEVAFIDTAVTDWQTLANGVRHGV
ncbi:MAG: DUF4347 domain-containing protein, partial [Undibacterium sp.]|nr:DUF4347 domain-containing protein [Undibacterium sp.]